MSHNNKSRWFYDYLRIYVLPRPTCCHIYYIVYPILLVLILPVVVASSSMPKLMLLMVVTLVSCLVLCYIIIGHLLNPRTVMNPNMTSKHILWLLVSGCLQCKWMFIIIIKGLSHFPANYPQPTQNRIGLTRPLSPRSAYVLSTHRDPFGDRRRRGRHGSPWGSCRWAPGCVPRNWHSRRKCPCTGLCTLRSGRPASLRTRCGPDSRCDGSRSADCLGSRAGTSTRAVHRPSLGNGPPFRTDSENIPRL